MSDAAEKDCGESGDPDFGVRELAPAFKDASLLASHQARYPEESEHLPSSLAEFTNRLFPRGTDSNRHPGSNVPTGDKDE
ncbi:MAG: hypothetical protein U0V70_05140 [Terriglobia bacterium]